jgi:hypothetical protein
MFFSLENDLLTHFHHVGTSFDPSILMNAQIIFQIPTHDPMKLIVFVCIVSVIKVDISPHFGKFVNPLRMFDGFGCGTELGHIIDPSKVITIATVSEPQLVKGFHGFSPK